MNTILILKSIKFSVFTYIAMNVFQLLIGLFSLNGKINHIAFKNGVFYLNHEQWGYDIKSSLVFLFVLAGGFYLSNVRRQRISR